MQTEWTKSDFCGDVEVGPNCGLSLEGTRHNLQRFCAMRDHLIEEGIEINKKIAILNQQIEKLEQDEIELDPEGVFGNCEGYPSMCDPCDYQLKCPFASTRSQAPSPGFDQEGGML